MSVAIVRGGSERSVEVEVVMDIVVVGGVEMPITVEIEGTVLVVLVVEVVVVAIVHQITVVHCSSNSKGSSTCHSHSYIYW